MHTLSRRSIPRRGLPGVVILTLGLTLALAGAAGAQERYTLDGEQWLKQTSHDPASPEGQLQAIRQQLANDKFHDAEKAADEWIKQYANHWLMPEALLVRGDAKVGRRHYWRALYDYELLVRTYPESELFHLGLEREYEIARLYAKGMKRRWLGMRILPATGEAEELFIRIQERAPGSDIGQKASLALGDFYFDRSEMGSAAEAYDLFLLNYPHSPSRERVMLRLIEATLANFKGPVYDATALLDATARIKQFQSEYPASAERLGADALLVRIHESLARKDLRAAQWYDGQDRLVSALFLYRRIVRDHEGTTSAATAAGRLRELGENVQEQPRPNPTGPAATAERAVMDSQPSSAPRGSEASR